MATFALISEGLTDQVILERIIEQMCDEIFEEGVEINPLQPLRDATDSKRAPHAGWELVLEYCQERAADALFTNDYVVIHLDTDQCDHPNFGVPLTVHGKKRPYGDLIQDTIAVITSRLGDAFSSTTSKRFLFAISVHSIESWLLIYFFDRDEPLKSMERLNRLLRKENKVPLAKEVRAYRRIGREIQRRKLQLLSGKDHSFGHFLALLNKLSPPRVS
jgi:hypothetical protein